MVLVISGARVPVINRDNVINQRGANPCKESHAKARKTQIESWIQIPAPGNDFFLQNIHSIVPVQSSWCGIFTLYYKCELYDVKVVSSIYAAN